MNEKALWTCRITCREEGKKDLCQFQSTAPGVAILFALRGTAHATAEILAEAVSELDEGELTGADADLSTALAQFAKSADRVIKAAKAARSEKSG